MAREQPITISLRYSDDGNAHLSASELCDAWPEIRRACEERTGEVVNTSGTSLTLPWWAFLDARESIRFVFACYPKEIAFIADPVAEKFLRESRARESRYKEAAAPRPLAVEEVASRLASAGFARPLKPYQARNVARLAPLPAGATFSVPGAGKTTEALAFFFLKRSAGSRLLVVAPKNAFAAWEEQLAVCAPSLAGRFKRLKGGIVERQLDERPEMALISYELLPRVRDSIARLLAQDATFLFLDESHRMKRGLTGVIGRAVLSLAHLPQAKLVMSGTPAPNEVGDLVPQFRFLYPEVRVDDSTVVERIKPFYVRTTQDDLGLPRIQAALIRVPMSEAQDKLYRLLASEESRLAERALRSRDRMALRSLGRSVMKLTQAASNPALLVSSNTSVPEVLREALAEGDSPKMDYVCRRARALAKEGQKVIIWSAFVENVELLATRLEDIGADFIHGGVEAGSEEDEETREAKIARFKTDSEALALVANPAACAEGISLHTVCRHAIYLDRTYNAAHFVQSQYRIHRLGMDMNCPTLIEILFSPGTVDESVNLRLDQKVSRMGQVLNDPSINVEPVLLDLEDTGMDEEDLQDFWRHLQEVTSKR